MAFRHHWTTEPARPQHTDQGNETPQTDPARFIGERQERERTRADITTEGAEAVHHFIGESLLRCAAHARPSRVPPAAVREATATAMDEARAMAGDGISNGLSGMASPAALVQYIRNDDGIYGCPSGSERAFFTHRMRCSTYM